MKRLLFLLLPAALAGPLALHAQPKGGVSQTTPGFQRLPSGTEYKLFRRDAAGRYQPRPLVVPTDSAYSTRQGKFLLAHITFLTGRDSVLNASRKQMRGKPAPIPLKPLPERPGPDEEAAALLLPGDSAVFRFNADSLFRGRQVPSELKRSGNVLVMQLTAVRLMTQAGMMRAQQDAMVAQAAREDAAIADYLAQNKLTGSAKRTPGGTTYVITQRGTGPLPQAGKSVKVKYRGMLLETGKEFDASERHGGEPFEFTLGAGQVIPGWDQGVAMLPVGSKAVLLIPSALGYGPRGMGADIPANSPLRFEVEVVSAAPATPPTPKPAGAAKKAPVKKAPVKKVPTKKK